MTDARIAAVAAEVLYAPPAPSLRAAAVAAEVLYAPPAPSAQFSSVAAEMLLSVPTADPAVVVETRNALGVTFATSQATAAFTTTPLATDVVVVVALKGDTSTCSGLGATYTRVLNSTPFFVFVGTNPSTTGAVTVSGTSQYRVTFAFLVRGLGSTDFAYNLAGSPLWAGPGQLAVAVRFGTNIPTTTPTPEAGWSTQVNGSMLSTDRANMRYRTPMVEEQHDMAWQSATNELLFTIGSEPVPPSSARIGRGWGIALN